MIERMKFLSITGPKDDIDRVIEEYLSKYDIQLENTLSELKNVKGLYPFTDPDPYKEAFAKAQTLRESFTDTDTAFSGPLPSVQEAASLIEELSQRVDVLTLEKEKLQTNLTHYQERLKSVNYFIGLNYDTEAILHFKYVKFRFGSMTREYYDKFMSFVYEGVDSIFHKAREIDDKVWGVYFVPASKAEKVDAIYSSMHFERFYLPEGYEGTPKQAAEHLEETITQITDQIEEKDRQILDALRAKKKEFFAACSRLEKFHKNFDIRKLAAATRMNKQGKRPFYILCGWLTADDADQLYLEIENDPDAFCVIEKDHSNLFSGPPTKLRNNPLFRPFEMFVEMYGLPNYKELDPTPLIGITYSILFGFMFGDMGQGAVLLAAGLLLARLKKSRLAAIIARCGFFSCIFGLLFGSVFGFEDIIDPLWLRPAKAMTALPVIGNLNTVFIVSVALGMGVIILMMLLNIINRLRLRQPGEAWFDTNGAAGLLFYAAAAAILVLFMTGHPVPAAGLLSIMFILPLMLIFFKEPLTHLIEKKAQILPKEKGMFLVQGVFELFEVLLSYFSNSLSFVRVGAFAVSHAAMMEVVLMLSGAQSGSINWFGIVLGNLFVMGMEGLIVGIQVLRLEYYELFSRFYSGTGREFLPYGK